MNDGQRESDVVMGKQSTFVNLKIPAELGDYSFNFEWAA